MSGLPPDSRRADRCWGRSRAMCGRLRVGRQTLHLRRGSGQPCVRPIGAVHVTAGYNALRGSGPDQKHAFKDAVAHVGRPDRRIDRRCITCCSPLPTVTSHRCAGCDPVYAARAAGSV
jgi:hypothetical protein